MSRENVEVVRELYRAFSEGETGGSFWALVDPDVEWVTDPMAPDSGTYRGHEGIKALLESWTTTFDAFRAEVDTIRAYGDKVIVTARLVGRMKGGREELNQPYAEVITIRDGKVLAIRDYSTEAEALEAVGLSE